MNKTSLRGNRGQAAIEFLVTYGWAIMAAMLVIGALTYFGITNPATSLPDKCVFSNAFECKDFIINDTVIRLKLINTAGQSVFGTGVSGNITASFTDIGGGSCDVKNTPQSLDPEAELEINCTNPPGYPFTPKEKAKVKITITYAKNYGGFSQVSLGEVYSTAQEGSI